MEEETTGLNEVGQQRSIDYSGPLYKMLAALLSGSERERDGPGPACSTTVTYEGRAETWGQRQHSHSFGCNEEQVMIVKDVLMGLKMDSC